MIEVVVMSQGNAEFSDRALTSLRSQKGLSEIFKFRIVENLKSLDRESEILKSSSEWIFFLDEDCYLPSPDYFENLRNLLKNDSEASVWGGLYLSERNASYRTKAYNELCNCWVLSSHFQTQTENLLGGCLLLHVPSIRPLVKENPVSWGGEDTFLLRQLQSGKALCRYSPELNVIHAPAPQSLWRVIRRAKLHGRNRKAHQLQTPRLSLKGFASALRNFAYWPFWLLHFAVLAAESRDLPFVRRDKRALS